MIKKLLLTVLMMVMVIGTAACGDGEGGSGNADSDGYKIGFSISTLDNPFFVDLEESAKVKAASLGCELIVIDAQNDPAKELSNVEDLISKGVDLILINPTDSDAVGSAVALANAAEIPVMTLDRSASTGDVVAHIASDNVAGGNMAGSYIVDILNGEGSVVELEGIQGASAAIERGRGFNEAVAGSDITIVARQTAGFDRAEGMSVMENILQAQPEIDAVFAHNDEMALGAMEAIKQSGRDIIIVGFDASDEAVAAVNAGDMSATVAQLPGEIGRIGVETAVKYLDGETVDEYIPISLELIF